MKVLTITRAEALELATKSGKEFYESSTIIDRIDFGWTDEAERILGNAFGETECYRTDDGDIFAWWV